MTRWLRWLRTLFASRGQRIKIDDHAQRAAIWREEDRERAELAAFAAEKLAENLKRREELG